MTVQRFALRSYSVAAAPPPENWDRRSMYLHEQIVQAEVELNGDQSPYQVILQIQFQTKIPDTIAAMDLGRWIRQLLVERLPEVPETALLKF
jgi:hypothetical protein